MTPRERIVAVAGVLLVGCAWLFVLGLAGRSALQSPDGLLPTQASLPTLTTAPSDVNSDSQTVQPLDSQVAPTHTPASAQQAESQMIIRFVPQTTQVERAAYVDSTGGVVSRRIDALNAVVVTLPQERTLQEPA